MESRAPEESYEFSVSLLPARSAYLVGARSRSGLTRAVQEASTRWGGITEPIIPVHADGHIPPLWEQVIEVAQIDGLVNVDLKEELADKVEANLGIPVIDISHIDRHGMTMFSTFPGSLEHPKESTLAYTANDNSDLCEITALGFLTKQAEEDYAQLEIDVRKAANSDEVELAQLDGNTLLDLSLVNFRENLARNSMILPTVIWITTPNSFSNCVFFWNFRALSCASFNVSPLVLVRKSSISQWGITHDRILKSLRRTVQVEPDVLLTGLRSDDALTDIAQMFGFELTSGNLKSKHSFPSPPPNPGPYTYRIDVHPYEYTMYDRRYGIVSNTRGVLNQGNNHLQVSSPVNSRRGGYTLLRVTSSAFEAIPKRDTIAASILQGSMWSNDEIQIQTNLQDYYNLNIYLPSIETVVQKLLKATNSTAKLSDKGQLGQRLYELVDTSIFCNTDVLKVVKSLTTPRSKELMRILEQRREQGDSDEKLLEIAAESSVRATRGYRPISRLGGNASELGKAAELLAHRSLAERGLEVKCKVCGLNSFVSLPEAHDLPMCPACKAEQYYQGKAGPEICYRLNALLDRASDQGLIPHLMALARLQLDTPKCYALLGVDFEYDDKNFEVDLYGAYKGQVMVGEAKTNANDFTKSQVVKDIEAAVALQADVYLMACPESISESDTLFAASEANKAGLAVVQVSATEISEL